MRFVNLIAIVILLGVTRASASDGGDAAPLVRRNLRSGGGNGGGGRDTDADAAAAVVPSTGAAAAAAGGRRRLAAGPFAESSCNSGVDAAPCSGIDSFLSANGIDPSTSEVLIPCGSCVSFDATDGSAYDFPRGLNVVGKLRVPESASFELRTKFVLVQGILRMDPPSDAKIPRSDGAVVKVVLTGTDAVTFSPDPLTDNGAACPAGGCSIGTKPFAVAGGRLDINAIHDSCPTWTKLKSLSADLTQITLTDSAAASCWAAGAELLLTPDGFDPAEAQVATIESVNLFDGAITLTAPLSRKLTSADDGYGEMYAVEVALLTRRVVLEPDDDAGAMGGHSIVMHTPNVVQNIRGVEFRRFGQQGRLGRYPVHFHMSDSVSGSVVSKNLVRESHQRCYVAHGTHDIVFSDNVAYDTFGHCYITEDGGEWNNYFIRNLGALTKNVPAGGMITAQAETDNQAATYWMTNVGNHYLDNVAAGSDEFGFWLDVQLRGDSASLPINAGVNPNTHPFTGTFEGNVAHSNDWHGISFYPCNYRPDDPAGIGAAYSYKNRGFGLRMGGTFNLRLNGGVMADNTNGGVEMTGALEDSTNVIENMTIVGVSTHLEDIIAEGRTATRPCNTVGVEYPPGKSWRGTSGGEDFLTELRSVTFEGFRDTPSCDARAIEPSTVAMTNGVPFAINTLISDGVSFEAGTSKPFSVCSAVAAGINGFALNDPTSGGFLVQENYDALTAFLPPNACHPAESGSCLSSCPGTCFRMIKVEIPGSEIHGSKQLKVTDASGASALVPRDVFRDVHKNYWRDVVPLYLPGNGNYNVSFVEQDGTTAAWPGYAYVSLGVAPSCPDHVEEANVNIDYPAPNDRCVNPIYNGDLERGDFHGFQDVMKAGMAMVTPGAAGTSHALRTTKQDRAAHGLWNHVDVSCLRAWAGRLIRLSGYLHTFDDGDADVASSVDVMLRVVDILGAETTLVPTTAVATNADGSWSFFETIVPLPPSVRPFW